MEQNIKSRKAALFKTAASLLAISSLAMSTFLSGCRHEYDCELQEIYLSMYDFSGKTPEQVISGLSMNHNALMLSGSLVPSKDDMTFNPVYNINPQLEYVKVVRLDDSKSEEDVSGLFNVLPDGIMSDIQVDLGKNNGHTISYLKGISKFYLQPKTPLEPGNYTFRIVGVMSDGSESRSNIGIITLTDD